MRATVTRCIYKKICVFVADIYTTISLESPAIIVKVQTLAPQSICEKWAHFASDAPERPLAALVAGVVTSSAARARPQGSQ